MLNYIQHQNQCHKLRCQSHQENLGSHAENWLPHLLMQYFLQHCSSPGPEHLWSSNWKENAACSGTLTFFPILMLQGCLAVASPSPPTAHRGVDGISLPLWRWSSSWFSKADLWSSLWSVSPLWKQASPYRPAFSGNCSLNHTGHTYSRFFSIPLESPIKNNL